MIQMLVAQSVQTYTAYDLSKFSGNKQKKIDKRYNLILLLSPISLWEILILTEKQKTHHTPIRSYPRTKVLKTGHYLTSYKISLYHKHL